MNQIKADIKWQAGAADSVENVDASNRLIAL
jgi:hypothetical protein